MEISIWDLYTNGMYWVLALSNFTKCNQDNIYLDYRWNDFNIYNINALYILKNFGIMYNTKIKRILRKIKEPFSVSESINI